MGIFIIRPAQLKDAAQIADVQTWSWREAYAGQLPADFLSDRVVPAARWQGILRNPDPQTAAWVALVDDTVVGFASCGPDQDLPDLGCLYALYVRAARQGRGLGHALLQAAMGSLVAAGFSDATLWSLASNAPALRFYEREGWRLDGCARTDDSMGIDMALVRMSRRLDQSEARRM